MKFKIVLLATYWMPVIAAGWWWYDTGSYEAFFASLVTMAWALIISAAITIGSEDPQ